MQHYLIYVSDLELFHCNTEKLKCSDKCNLDTNSYIIYSFINDPLSVLSLLILFKCVQSHSNFQRIIFHFLYNVNTSLKFLFTNVKLKYY